MMIRSEKKRMLITGVSGLLGNNLARYFREKYQVLGLFQEHPVSIEGVQTLHADIRSDISLRGIVEANLPDVLIHCASLTNIDFCESHKELTQEINVSGTKNVVDSIQRSDCKLIYISSDSVYDGIKGNFRETDPVGPQNFYGYSKHQGELEILRKDRSLILRTNIFGWNIQNKYSIAEWILHELMDSRTIEGFRDVRFSSIYNFHLSEIIDESINKDLSGIYNCASKTCLTKYEFAIEIARRFNLATTLVKPISIDDYPFSARRGKNLSLSVDKIENALNIKLPTMAMSLDAFCHDFNDGLSYRIRAGGISYGSTQQPFLFYGKQHIDDDDIQSVVATLKSNNLTQGPRVYEFEAVLCKTVDAPFAIACNSGTSALHIACLAADLKQGDEVITTPITFVASANCALYCGAKPVFADIDSRTYNISAEEIEKKITNRTRAIIPVHFAGQSCEMEEIQDIVHSAEKKYGTKICIIEDACHALGSLYRGTKIGSCVYADMTVMSFHPVKHITTGEGGIVFTKDPSLFRRLQLLRSHGITSDPEEFLNDDIAFQSCDQKERNPWYYEQIDLGFNYRITDIQCALGLSQIQKLKDFRKKRRMIVNMYNSLFRESELIQIPYETEPQSSNFHLYVLLFDFSKMTRDRARFMLQLRLQGIQTQVHYIPVHLQSFYRKKYGYHWGDYPVAEEYYSKCLSIPLFPALTDIDVKRVHHEITRLVRHA